MKTAARCALFAALLVGPLVAAGTTAKPEDVGPVVGTAAAHHRR